MSLTRTLLTALLLDIATTAAGPPALTRDVLRASFRDARKSLLNGVVEDMRLKTEATKERDPLRLSTMEDAARGVLPSPLWDTLFHDLPDLLESITDSKTQVAPQSHSGWLQRLAPYYLPDVANVSSECSRDVQALSVGLAGHKSWALKVVDSWGKFLDGVLAGNLWATGLLDECLQTTVESQDPEAQFRGQYCSFSISTKPKNASAQSLARKDGEEDERDRTTVVLPNLRVANVKGILETTIPYNLLATCIPSTCTKEEYRLSLEKQLDARGLKLEMLGCQTKDLPTMQYNTADIIMIVTLSLLGFLVLVGTLTDVWIHISKKEHVAKGPMRYFLVFSFYTNLPKIFHINVKENKEVVSCLHGIRVLSMCWVLLAHNYMNALLSSANKALVPNMMKERLFMYQVILNGYPSVDTFFVMSGLLVAYSLTKEFQRTSRFNAPLYYVHRFVRLAPPIMLLCGFFAVFPPLFVQGSLSPLMVKEGRLVDLCLRYWWRDSFFITNFFGNGQSCLPVCWYTSAEFQLYIVTPLMFLPLLYRRRLGAVVLGSFVFASVIIPAAIIGASQLPPGSVTGASADDSNDYFTEVYEKPYCRASPYLVGLAMGYFLRVVDKEKLHLTWWQVTLGWIAALATMSAVVFGLKDYNSFSGLHKYNPFISILYGGLNRLAWGAAVSWLVFACHTGYGGPINSLLAHPFWQPLSRLTYAIFLISYNAQRIYYYYYFRLPNYYTPFNMLMETSGMLLISGCGAVLVSLLAESPVLGLEKLLLKRTS